MALPGRFVFPVLRTWASISEECGVGRDALYVEEDIAVDGQPDLEVRAAHSQALFRAVNEKIRAVNDEFAELTGAFTVACECADSGCLEMVELPVDVYERVRASPYTFVVLRDHVQPGVESVVAEGGAYVVVEMTGRVARGILEETAPQRTRDAEAR